MQKKEPTINTVNGLVFKDDLLLMTEDTGIPTNQEHNAVYLGALTVRETAWYKENTQWYEDSLNDAKYINGLFKKTFLDTYNADGSLTGEVKSYDDVHKHGLWHKGVHVWVINADGQLLIHRRGEKVQTRPGVWENSASGHVDAGHTSLQTAQKELLEEVGIDIPLEKFELIGTITDQFVTNGGMTINNEFDDFYIVSIGDSVIDVKINETEVAEIKWMHFSELQERINEQDPLYMPRQAEYDILFPLLHERFDTLTH